MTNTHDEYDRMAKKNDGTQLLIKENEMNITDLEKCQNESPYKLPSSRTHHLSYHHSYQLGIKSPHTKSVHNKSLLVKSITQKSIRSQKSQNSDLSGYYEQFSKNSMNTKQRMQSSMNKRKRMKRSRGQALRNVIFQTQGPDFNSSTDNNMLTD